MEKETDREGARVELSYTTSDVDGKQRPHSCVWWSEVYFFFPANVTDTFLSSEQTGHCLSHLPPAPEKTDVASFGTTYIQTANVIHPFVRGECL